MIGDEPFDRYELYEELYQSRWDDHRDERRTKPKYQTLSERMREQVLAELTEEASDLELGFQPTYRPSRHEQGWLLAALRPFYDQGLIDDVLARIKGGKEANVYLCQGAQVQPGPGAGAERPGSDGGSDAASDRPAGLPVPRQAPLPRLLAAKVYRPRMFRNLRNDALYRQGREVMVVGGKAAGKQASTLARAIRNKTPFGMEAAHISWLMHEYAALDTLYRAGAAVPRAWGAAENAVLMDYWGDEGAAAPLLVSVELEPVEAFTLFHEVLRNVELMLRHGLIHGDLSAYNILYWQGRIALIDFPQVVRLDGNSDARWILHRDLERVCDYFRLQGLRCDPAGLADELWRRHTGEMSAEDLAADWSRHTQDG